MRRISTLAVVTALVLSAAPTVGADPTGGAGPVAPVVSGNGNSMTWAELGTQKAIPFRFGRSNSRSSLTFPVPTGMTPTALSAKVELPIPVRFGTLTVSQGDRTIARLPLPEKDQGAVVIPLAGVEVYGNWATVAFTMTAVPPDNYCWDPSAPVRLVDGSISFAGSPKPPKTVAEFLPAVLRKVTIGVPAKPSPAESNAAIQVAAAVANHSGQRPAIELVPLPDGSTALPGSSSPYERRIVIKGGLKKGLSLQGGPVPSLLISGAGEELAEQARLLSSDGLRFATSSGATADELPTMQSVGVNTTLADLRRNGESLTDEAMWPTVAIELDQTRWGHPIGQVVVHLQGSYTPLPGAFGGEVTATVGGELIDRWTADALGTIDRTVTIPDRLLGRSTVLDVEVRTTGNPGHCGDPLPVTLRVLGSTSISTGPTHDDPPLPQGFQAFPQTAMPRIRVGIGSEALLDTARAAQIIVGLQRASSAPLATEVTTVQEALAAPQSAVVVAAEGWNDPGVPLPFSADRGRVKVEGLNSKGDAVSLELDPAVKFGSLQAFFDGQRSLLVATSNGAPDQLDGLLRYLADEPGRWSGLNGRAIITAPGVEPITVPNLPDSYAGEPVEPSSAQNWFWWAAGGIAAIATLGAVGILMRARRS